MSISKEEKRTAENHNTTDSLLQEIEQKKRN